MARLGRRQAEFLALMANVGCALVVPNAHSRALVKRGLMEPTGDQPGSEEAFIVINAAGFRALADAIDAGQVRHRPDWAAIRAKKAGSE